MGVCTHEQVGGLRFPGAGVTGLCETPDLRAEKQIRTLRKSSPVKLILKGKGTKRKTRVRECGPVVEYLHSEGVLCVQSPELCDEGSYHHQTRQESQKKATGCVLSEELKVHSGEQTAMEWTVPFFH